MQLPALLRSRAVRSILLQIETGVRNMSNNYFSERVGWTAELIAAWEATGQYMFFKVNGGWIRFERKAK
jgi:hypothetical protein